MAVKIVFCSNFSIFFFVDCTIGAFWRQNGPRTPHLVNSCGTNCEMLLWERRISDGPPSVKRVERCRCQQRATLVYWIELRPDRR